MPTAGTSPSRPVPNAALAGLALALMFALALPGCGPSPTTTTQDGSTMILIPEGQFPMGGKPEEVAEDPHKELLTYLAERPVHNVRLDAYYIDQYEITNAQYRRFLEAEAQDPGRWDHPDQPADVSHQPRFVTDDLTGDDQPAVGLNWFDAFAYCSWAGKRLPTEAEWERAARGDTYKTYPWGSEAPYADGIWWANYRPEEGPSADGHRHTAPVGSYPDGVSGYGIADLAGNAEEWVQDWYAVDYFGLVEDGVENPPGPLKGDKKVIKGGSYESGIHQVRVAMRLFGRPRDKGPRLGFRCAMDP